MYRDRFDPHSNAPLLDAVLNASQLKQALFTYAQPD